MGDMTSVMANAKPLGKLVAEAREGNRAAAERLVREHDGWVRSVVYAVTGRAELVEDVTQQVWTRVLARLETLQDARCLRSWLYTIARHTAIDMGQAHQRQRVGSLEGVVVEEDKQQRGPFRVVAGNELQETLLYAVESLPVLYREPFVLRHLQDWSYAEIGEVLDLSVEAVETRLVRARRLLREMLDGRVE